MRYIINDQVVLSRPLEGPLAAHIGSFARWVNEQGYAFCSLRRQVLLAACFSHWLGEKDVRVHSVWSEQAVQYLRYRARRVQIHKGDTAALRYLIEFLNREGVIPVEETAEPRPNPVEQCAGEFERYLREERVWLRRPSSTTCRISGVSSNIVSATEQSSCRTCVRAMWSHSSSGRRRVCIQSVQNC